MKKQYFLAIAMFMLLTVFAACSSDDNLDNGKGKVDVASKFEFPVTFADYNSDVQVGNTRAAANSSDTLRHEFVNMGNGIVADVTLQKDKENLSNRAFPETRVLNGDYTMLAYQSGVLKGELKGFISGGNFIPNAGDPTAMSLAPGNYDFVLYPTSFFTRRGNNLTLTYASEYSILGRTSYTVTATPQKQKVPFAMKHTAARVRVKFNTYVKVQPSNIDVSFSAANPAEIPSSVVYDAATGTWSSSGTGGSFSFGTRTWTEVDNGAAIPKYSYTSPGYSYIFPGANITTLKMSFFNTIIYQQNLNGKEVTFALNPVLSSVANGSYLISITFHYNFLYLMTDGTTGLFSETTYGGGTKTPIAIVASQSKSLAAALKNAPDGKLSNIYGTINSKQLTAPGWMQYWYPNEFETDGADGYKFTWEATGSADGATIKANEQTNYPAFYNAAHYVPTLPAGKVLTGSIVGKKWFLPSFGEVTRLYKAVLIGSVYSPVSQYVSDMWNSVWSTNPAYAYGMLKMAFGQVGGEVPDQILTSSTINNDAVTINPLSVVKHGSTIVKPVRPFIHY